MAINKFFCVKKIKSYTKLFYNHVFRNLDTSTLWNNNRQILDHYNLVIIKYLVASHFEKYHPCVK